MSILRHILDVMTIWYFPEMKIASSTHHKFLLDVPLVYKVIAYTWEIWVVHAFLAVWRHILRHNSVKNSKFYYTVLVLIAIFHFTPHLWKLAFSYKDGIWVVYDSIGKWRHLWRHKTRNFFYCISIILYSSSAFIWHLFCENQSINTEYV